MATVAYAVAAVAPSVGGAIVEELASYMLDALANGERAWMTPDELAGAVGWTVEAAERAVEAGVGLGWLARWDDCPTGPSVTLSPLAAARLGLAIGPDAAWHPATDPASDGNFVAGRTPGGRSARDAEDDDGLFGTSFYRPDPRAVDPAEAAAEAERLAELASNPRVARLLSGSALPSRVVGLKPIWPASIVDGVCPGCGADGPDAIDCVCLICHRSGLDHLIRGRR